MNPDVATANGGNERNGDNSVTVSVSGEILQKDEKKVLYTILRGEVIRPRKKNINNLRNNLILFGDTRAWLAKRFCEIWCLNIYTLLLTFKTSRAKSPFNVQFCFQSYTDR